MRKMTGPKQSLLLALIAEGATGIVISSLGVWRATGEDPTGQADPGYATTETWTTPTVMALWGEDLLLSRERGSMVISAAGRVRGRELAAQRKAVAS